MATLEKIRNRAGVLVAVVIGLALLAFILGDFLNSGQTLFSNSQFEIAEIAGKSVSFQNFQKDLNEVIEIQKFTSGQATLDEMAMQRAQQQTWNDLLRQYVLNEEYSNIGLAVSSDELWDMVQGENIHPIIQNLFTNPETGEVNTMQIIRFLKSYDQDPTGQQKAYWLFVEEQMMQDRLYTKYTNLISKGLYTPKMEAQFELNNNSKTVDFEFVSLNINSVADSLIKVSDSELKAYYNDHQNNYKQSASRTIEYITFDVVPSETDKKDAEEWINSIKPEFATIEDDFDYVRLNGDITADNSYYKKDELPEEYASLFDATKGEIVGPFFKDGIYQLAKLSEVAYLPDSVKARHILLQPQRNQSSSEIFALGDSIKGLLEKGANFAELSNKFSADKAANEKGGDLGWFRANQMVSPFSDTCFIAKKGEIKTVATQFGLHIVQVTDKAREEKKVKVAVLGRKLEPSQQTVERTYAEASKFAGNNHSYKEFVEAIEKEGLTKKVAPNIKEADQQIAGLEHPRELIRSIYNTELKEIVKSQNDPIFSLGDRFVIGFVTEIKEEGIAPLEQVKAQVTVQVKKEKKAQQLVGKFNEALKENNDLQAVASKLNTKVFEASDVNFRTFNIPNAGIEPNVAAVATNMEQGQVSNPVIGNNAVFVLKVNSVVTEENANVEMQQLQTMMQLKNRAGYEVFEALKENANIVDKRAKFY